MEKEFQGDDLVGQEIMADLINYCDYVFNLVNDEIKGNEVLDFGSGYGDFCSFLISNKVETYGYEPNIQAFESSSLKGIKTFFTIEELQKSYMTVTSLNVLEHIEDDINGLNQIKSILNESGNLILYLPSSMSVWSQMDIDANHHRRYSKREIIQKLESTGFEIKKIHYVDFIGWAVLILFKFLRIKPKFNKRLLIFYDKYFFKYLKFLDLIFKNFIGKNLLIVANIK